jgi:tRNA pseudouridine55 synthase
MTTTTTEGFVIAVDKPVGPTSFDVVARLRRAFRERRVGHTGTLDPLASGLMLVCVGPATRLVPWLTDADKVYLAEVSLGRETTSGDLDGETVEGPDDGLEVAGALSALQLETALRGFVGEIDQVPPVFSAIRVDGKRAYERARAGEKVEMASRRVRIDRLELRAWRSPIASVEIACGKGTYVRSLAVDLGRALGCGGHLAGLRRLAVGPHRLEHAWTLDAIEADPAGAAAAALTPARALEALPAYRPEGRALDDVLQGRPHRAPDDVGLELTRVLDATDRLLALVARDDTGQVRVVRGFGASA